MPFRTEHASRIKEPNLFKEDEYRRVNGGKAVLPGAGLIDVPASIVVLWGQLKNQTGDERAVQALRFPITKWTSDEARKWLKENKIKYIVFESAKPEEKNEIRQKFYQKFDLKIQNSKEENDFFYFEGYASVFDHINHNKSLIKKGSFENSLLTIKPILLWQHQNNQPIGVFDEIYEDEKGLYLKARMPKDDTFVSGRVIPQIKIGSINSMSISGYMTKYEKKIINDETISIVNELELLEVSLVSFPADVHANITKISASIDDIDNISNIADFNKFLRSVGFSRNQTEKLIYKFKNIKNFDPDFEENLSQNFEEKNILQSNFEECLKNLKNTRIIL